MLCSDDQYLAILIREAKSWSPGRTYFLKLKLEEIKEGKKRKQWFLVMLQQPLKCLNKTLSFNLHRLYMNETHLFIQRC